MDFNNSNLSETVPKAEVDSDYEFTSTADFRIQWTSESTFKLIELLEKECRELWDAKHSMYKDRVVRQARLAYLANVFDTTSEEITRKIHNLRTQFNNELRKIKRRQLAGGGAGDAGGSGWEYFEALSFLLREPAFDPLENVDGVNLALAEFQANEEEEFGPRVQETSVISLVPSSREGRARTCLRVAASAPPPLPPSANPMMWPEEPVPRLRPGANADECQIFGDFVASELRTLRSDDSRKRLKRMIQKAILKIGEEEDVNMING